MREELRAPFAGVQQQHGAGSEVDDSSTAARQQHVLSGPHAVVGSSAPLEDVVISLTSSVKVLFLSFSAVVRFLSSTVPCSTALIWNVEFFGAVIVESSDLCSSVKDSSQVT